jgi:hypothetical protein
MDNKYTNMSEGMNPHSTNQTKTFHLFIFLLQRAHLIAFFKSSVVRID